MTKRDRNYYRTLINETNMFCSKYNVIDPEVREKLILLAIPELTKRSEIELEIETAIEEKERKETNNGWFLETGVYLANRLVEKVENSDFSKERVYTLMSKSMLLMTILFAMIKAVVCRSTTTASTNAVEEMNTEIASKMTGSSCTTIPVPKQSSHPSSTDILMSCSLKNKQFLEDQEEQKNLTMLSKKTLSIVALIICVSILLMVYNH